LKAHNQLIEDIKILNERYLYDKILIDNLKNEVKKLKENPQYSYDKTGIFKEISVDIKDTIKKLREYLNIPIEINNDFYIDDLDRISLLLKEINKYVNIDSLNPNKIFPKIIKLKDQTFCTLCKFFKPANAQDIKLCQRHAICSGCNNNYSKKIKFLKEKSCFCIN